MSDIFREVDEEVKRDKVAQFLKKHGSLIILALVLLVVGVGAFRYYKFTTEKQAAAAGKLFEQALSFETDGKSEEARGLFEKLSKEGPKGYQVLARLRLAADLAKSDAAGAAKAYDAIAGDASVEAHLRDLAKVRSALLGLDSASFADLAAKLEPFTAQGQAWRILAREGLGLAAYKAGDMATATKYFDQILGDTEVPPTARQRAEMMMSLLRGGAVQPK